MKAVKARKDEISARSRTRFESWLKDMPGSTVYKGHARFESAREVTVSGHLLTADQIFINEGGRAIVATMPGIDQINFLTHTSILQLDTLPHHLVVIGGSYIGLEFAQMSRRFGSEVTIVETAPRLIQHEDADISAAVREILEAEKIIVRLDAQCVHFEPRGIEIAVRLSCTLGPPDIQASHVLLAVGRRPNTDDLNLMKAGVELDKRG
jgi:pyruvate/2-oxoglutarate dehydrogenase complex dihydrolipoamide dehydrogenase (E3) component